MTFVSFQHRRSTNKIIVDYYQRFTCFDRIGYYLSRKIILALIQRGAIHILLANISPEYRNYTCRSLNRNKETLLSSPVSEHLWRLAVNNLNITICCRLWSEIAERIRQYSPTVSAPAIISMAVRKGKYYRVDARPNPEDETWSPL